MESWETTLFPNALNQPGPVVVLDEVEKPAIWEQFLEAWKHLVGQVYLI